MTTSSPLVLRSQADRRIKKGHLWIYSNEIDTQKSPLNNFSAGQLVPVQNASGQSLGLAFVNPNSLICGRILSRDADANINTKFFKRLLKQALSLRELNFSEPYYRLVYGDSDFLPGLVVDRFGDQLVVQTSTAGFDHLMEPLLEALDNLLQPKAMIIRNNHSARELEGLQPSIDTIGDADENLTVIENGCRFEIPATTGQKTGWFYDHRMNRAQLQTLVKGKRVLDVFSYVGAWGLQAGVAGASEVYCVDASATAMDALLHNATLNGLGDQVTGLQGKAVEVLKSLIEEEQRFDVVVLDPPAFIKRKKDHKSGLAAYRHLNELAIRLLSRDGVLVSASCSMALREDELKEIVRGAARHLDRNAQCFWQGGQGPDHPVHPAIPETEYLKAQFYRLLRA